MLVTRFSQYTSELNVNVVDSLCSLAASQLIQIIFHFLLTLGLCPATVLIFSDWMSKRFSVLLLTLSEMASNMALIFPR